jgi:hypothetical protein
MDHKRLVVCCDGTWIEADSAAEFTNVARTARAIRPNDDRFSQATPQIVYYHSGVGGVLPAARDVYGFLVANYCEGDEIFLFGFSRGAYIARSVAGLIGWVGLIHKGDMDDFSLLWEGYRLRQPDARMHFPNRYASVPIKCIGVWDTVGALGIPGHLGDIFSQFYQFQDTYLGPHGENAFHALALDEHREDFLPTLWTRLPDAPAMQRLEQVWFPGAHSNVGGGYAEHGLSDVALAWMADRVEPFLALDHPYLSTRQDQRDGWGLGKIYDSAAGFFALRRKVNRPILASGEDNEKIHESVAIRLRAAAPGGLYRPASLAHGLRMDNLAVLGAVERELRWSAPNPAQTGRTSRATPALVDRLMVVGGSDYVVDVVGGGALPFVHFEAWRKELERSSADEPEKADYLVWYGTNRRPKDPGDIKKGYSAARDVVVRYGSCRVFIPKSHKNGSIGSPWWKRLLTWTDDRLRLIDIGALPSDAYWAAVAARLAAVTDQERNALIFVHGYNLSFEDAALRAAQIGFDLSIKGAMAFFSWPSQGVPARYPADEATIEASEGAIADFMTDFAERSGAGACMSSPTAWAIAAYCAPSNGSRQEHSGEPASRSARSCWRRPMSTLTPFAIWLRRMSRSPIAPPSTSRSATSRSRRRVGCTRSRGRA